jgi:hypothetical protein
MLSAPTRLIDLILPVILLLGLAVSPAHAQEPVPTPTEPLELSLTLTAATVEPSGAVTVTLNVTCSHPAQLAVFTEIIQPLDPRFSVVGFGELGSPPFDPFGDPVPCMGQETLSLLVIPQNGRFRPGTAFIRATALGCVPPPDPVEPVPFPENCDTAQIVTTIQLHQAQ